MAAKHLIPTAVSLAVSATAATLVWNLDVSLLFCSLMLAHELGHYAAARAGRLAITGPIVIFPLGGVVLCSPAKSRRRARAEAAVISSGPLSGALFGTLACGYWLLTGSDWALSFAQLSVTYNLLNLAPAGMLDGGRLAGLAGIPSPVCVVLCVPFLLRDWWFLLAVVPALAIGQVSWPPKDPAERQTVRRLALGGWLLAFCWLVALRCMLP